MSDIRYIDTRGLGGDSVPFTKAVVSGIAPGGGLFIPTELPHFDLGEIIALANLSYAQRAAAIYKAFGVDLPADKIDELMADAYGKQFDTEEICPITTLEDGVHILELWHGPTSAFKDMALQCLPRFFSASAEQLRANGELDSHHLILVATSGDTGKAALEGFADVPGLQIAVTYPDGGVSDIQFKQMATQRGNNVRVWGVRGNFDDCQTGVKRVFGDAEFNKKLKSEYGIELSSANSINWGRLLPQVVYYVNAYATLVAEEKIIAGNPIDICVPTGNFGNILAAWYAKQIGTPIDMLICASNENNVLTDFINTGTYDISDRPFVLTPSPSMDILVSSNLERLLFEISGRNAETVRTWMSELAENKKYRVDPQTFANVRADFAADFVDSETGLQTIKEVWENHNYLIDTHTAIAYKVAERLRGQNPVVVASTAHWAKFGVNVYRALHDIKPGEALPEDVASLSGCDLNRLIERETGLKDAIPRGLNELDSLPNRFTEVIDRGESSIEAATLAFLSE